MKIRNLINIYSARDQVYNALFWDNVVRKWNKEEIGTTNTWGVV